MKAIVKQEAKPGVALVEKPVPKISEREILIKIHATSICGTDVHIYEWDEWARKTIPVPCTIGHEFVGEVVEVGKQVRAFKVGDRVSGEGHITCGSCLPCKTGQRVLCPNTIGVGVNRDGCFAEYLALPEENGFLMPKEVPDEIATIFDPLGNAVHTALSFDLVGRDVLITGAGPIGLMSIAIAKKAGARHVVITDVNDYRIALARRMGATRAVDVRKESLKQVMSDLGIAEKGFEVCLEMSGSAQVLSELSDVASHGGKLVLLGILPEEAKIDWHKVIFKMLTIKGIYGREIFRTWYDMLHLLQSGLDIAPIVTHHFPYQEYEKGFEVMLSKQSGKVVLHWS